MRLLIILVGAFICVITAGLFWISQLSLIPYNIRELVVDEYPLFSSFLFACFLVWSCGVPTLIAFWFNNSSKKIWTFFGVAIVHGLVGFVFLRSAVPTESIHDILGSPILFWPWEFELIGRFLALYFIITFSFSFSALLSFLIIFGDNRSILLRYLAYGLMFSTFSHYIVFERASTDNLTELIESGGTLYSSFLLILFLMIVSLVASQFALIVSRINIGSKRIILLLALISFPAAFLCVYTATENSVLKYGQEFSALQFLLSPDRQHLVETPELLLRYAIVHSAIVLLIALVQIPFWLWIFRRNMSPILHETHEV